MAPVLLLPLLLSLLLLLLSSAWFGAAASCGASASGLPLFTESSGMSRRDTPPKSACLSIILCRAMTVAAGASKSDDGSLRAWSQSKSMCWVVLRRAGILEGSVSRATSKP